MRVTAFRLAIAVTIAGGAFSSETAAQSMTPMRGEIYSYSDEFALKVFPKNNYDRKIEFDVRAYDENFRPIDAMIWPKTFFVGPGGARPVTVLVKFAGATQRKVRVCAESVPFPDQQTQIKARICGRFLGYRLQ